MSVPKSYRFRARSFKKNVKVTPFMMTTSEICGKDRRGVTPQHTLYMAMKILRLRVSQGLYATFRCVGETAHITKRMIENEEYLESCRGKLVLSQIHTQLGAVLTAT
jgi:hypothetical protein